MGPVGSDRYVVLRHLKTSRMAEVCEYVSGPLALAAPDDVLKTQFVYLDCDHCEDRLRVRLYSNRRLRVDRAIACVAAAVLWASAMAGAIWLFQDYLLVPDPLRTRAEIALPVLSALAPGTMAAVMTRRPFTISNVALREPRAWATNQEHRHTIEEIRT
jgi:hypothetical protein